MRQIHVRAKWQSSHTIEVPDDHPQIEANDLDTLLDASGEDILSNVAELTDWDFTDKGPKTNAD